MNKRSLGAGKEALAASYLEKKGFRILTQNFRCRAGEIDLIARDGEEIVFIEVKYRSSSSCGFPEEAVSFRKQKTICRVADRYRSVRGLSDRYSFRFDVVAISGEKIRHYTNAFGYIPF